MHVESDITIIAPAIAGVVLAVSSLIYFCFLKESSGSSETASRIDEFASVLAGTRNDLKEAARNKSKKLKTSMKRQQSQQQNQAAAAAAEKKQKREAQTKQDITVEASSSDAQEHALQPSTSSTIEKLTAASQAMKKEVLTKAHVITDKISDLTLNAREASAAASGNYRLKAVTAAQHAKDEVLAKLHDVTDKVTSLGQQTIVNTRESLSTITGKLSSSEVKHLQTAPQSGRDDDLPNDKELSATVHESETGGSNLSSGHDTNKSGKRRKPVNSSGKDQQKTERQKNQQPGKLKSTDSDAVQKSVFMSNIPASAAGVNGNFPSYSNEDSSFVNPNDKLLVGSANTKPLDERQVNDMLEANSSSRKNSADSDEQLREQQRRVNALFQQQADYLQVAPVNSSDSKNKTTYLAGAVGDQQYRTQSRQSNNSLSFNDNNVTDTKNSVGAAAAGGEVGSQSNKRPRNKPVDKQQAVGDMQSKSPSLTSSGGTATRVSQKPVDQGKVIEERREETTITTSIAPVPAAVVQVRTHAAAAAVGGTAGGRRVKALPKNINGHASNSPAVNEDVQQIGELIMATNLSNEDYGRLSRIVTEKGASVYGDEWFESNKKGLTRQAQPNQQAALIPGFAAHLLHQKEQELEHELKHSARLTQQAEQAQKQHQQLQRQLNEQRTKSQNDSANVRQQYEQTMQARNVELQRLKEQLQSLAPQLSDTQRLRAELVEKASQFEQVRQLQVSTSQQYEREKQQLLRELHAAKQDANEQRSHDVEQAQAQLREQHQQELQVLQQQAHVQEHHYNQKLAELERALREQREADVKRVEERTQQKANDTVEMLNAQLREQIEHRQQLERQIVDVHREMDTLSERHQTTISTTEEKVRQLEKQIEQRERDWQTSEQNSKASGEKLAKQLAEAAAESETLRKQLEQTQQELDRSKQQTDNAVGKVRDIFDTEMEQLRTRAESAEASLAAIEAERQQQQTGEAKRMQQKEQRVAELETLNKQLESQLQKLRETDERRTTQIKELKENSRRIRDEMQQQIQQASSTNFALNAKDSVASSESNDYEIINHTNNNNNNNNNNTDAVLLRQQIEAVDTLRSEVSSAEKLVSKLEADYSELVEAHNSRTSGDAVANGGDGDTQVIVKKVVTVTTEQHEVPINADQVIENIQVNETHTNA